MTDHNRLHIGMLAAEAVPFVKVGGLADVVGALPKELEKLGARLTLLIPAYKAIRHDEFEIRSYGPIPDFDVSMGHGSALAEVYRGSMPATEIDVYLIGCADYFYRDGIYDDPKTGEGYLDNMERFVFFMKAGIELIQRLGIPVDIIHCHDCQTGLIPGLLRTTLNTEQFFARTGALFTIHNLAYQGLYGKEALYWAGIDYRHFYPTSAFEFWGKVNFMKVGIECADLVNTVSDGYAQEIQSGPEYGYGLEGVLRSRKEDLYGIVNGIDYEEWNPETDPLIPAPFSAGDLSGKAVCKAELLKIFGFPRQNSRLPLVGIVSRLADQKGFDLIAEAWEEIVNMDLQMVVLGSGQKKYHDLLEHMAARYPHKVGVRLAFDVKLAHQIIAGSDIFLMPSRYEPCGLNQLYSLRYGTVPVVRSTGGLADTVTNYDLTKNSGSGFSFKNYSAREMTITLKRALLIYSDPERWRQLLVRDMSEDWSWGRSAGKYMQLYQRIHRKRC